jgi:hypothetical protein
MNRHVQKAAIENESYVALLRIGSPAKSARAHDAVNRDCDAAEFGNPFLNLILGPEIPAIPPQRGKAGALTNPVVDHAAALAGILAFHFVKNKFLNVHFQKSG